MTVLAPLRQDSPGTRQRVTAAISAVWECGVAKSERTGYTVPVLPIGNKNRLPFGNRKEIHLRHAASANLWLPPYAAVYFDAVDDRIEGIVNIAMIIFAAGEPTERLVSITRPEHAVSDAALEILNLSRVRIERSPSIWDLVPKIQEFAPDLPIATHDVGASRTLLPVLPGKTWISVKAIAERAWPLESDLRLERLATSIGLRHWSLDEIPIDRAETLALTTGLLLREALTVLSSFISNSAVVTADQRLGSQWN